MRFDKLAGASLLTLSIALTLAACASDPTEEESDADTDSALQGTSANDKTAFVYFLNKGLTKTQAAAIVGNLDQESSMSPTAKQAGGPGRGIAQWSVNGRWVQENAFAKKEGGSATSLQVQLDFVWHELTTDAAFGLASLKQATTIASAVEIFQDKYEMCGKCANGSRVTFAERALKTFGGLSASAKPATATSSSSSASSSSSSSVSSSSSTGASDSTSGDDDDDDDDSSIPDCIVDGVGGSCVSTSSCGAAGGFSTPGLCPGAANIQCCTFK